MPRRDSTGSLKVVWLAVLLGGWYSRSANNRPFGAVDDVQTFSILVVVALDGAVNDPSGKPFDREGFHHLLTAIVIPLGLLIEIEILELPYRRQSPSLLQRNGPVSPLANLLRFALRKVEISV